MARNDIKKMNYPMVERMMRTMDDGAKRLESSIGEMNKVATTLDQGGLRGDAGAAFVQAIRGSLIPSMQRLQEKFKEQQGDLLVAMNAMKEADQTAARANRT